MNKALTNNEVTNFLKHVPGFNGTYPRDYFTGKIKPLESGVINLDVSTGPGTHFTCYFNSPKSEYVMYFDSYGAPCPEIIKSYLKTSGKMILYNTSEFQPIQSKMCGYYCIYVIQELSNGKSFYDVIAKFDMNNYAANDELLRKYFSGQLRHK